VPYRVASLLRFDGAEILLLRQKQRGFVQAYGVFPRALRPDEKRPTSRFRIERTPASIVGQLLRGTADQPPFLPAYETLFQAIAREMDAERRLLLDDRSFIARCTRLGQGVARGPADMRAEIGGLEIRALPDGTARISGNVPRAIALELAELLGRRAP
jgi:hypothetical protein